MVVVGRGRPRIAQSMKRGADRLHDYLAQVIGPLHLTDAVALTQTLDLDGDPAHTRSANVFSIRRK